MNLSPDASSPDCLQTSGQILNMFEKVAPRYDLLNHCLSLGLDFFWRKKLVNEAIRTQPEFILDLATGTGDVLIRLQSKIKSYSGVAAGMDFCRPMLERAKQKGAINLIFADALNLPCQNNSIDVITIAFGLRNLTHRNIFFKEALRVLKPNGQLLILEFSQPKSWFAPLYFAYLKHLSPKLAQWLGASCEAYLYLGNSIRQFPDKESLVKELTQIGFKNVSYEAYTFGTVALHMAYRPEERVTSGG